MFKLFGIKLDKAEFDALMNAQAMGKELKVVDGKVVAVEHEYTQEEYETLILLPTLKAELNALSQDMVQYSLGAIIEDIETRKLRFIEVHNQIRALQHKTPREYTVSQQIMN